MRPPFLSCAALVAVIALLAGPRAAAADPHLLQDSTVSEIWRLDNGLRVIVRHVQGSGRVAMTLTWPVGSDQDPPAQQGRADLLAELLMTAEAGTTPERSREELDRLRPLGWEAGAGARLTHVTEIVTAAQFPGALRQLAERLAGVTLSDSGTARAIASLRDDERARQAPTGNAELYAATRRTGLGGYDPAGVENGLRSLGRLKRAELQAAMRATFVPSGAVLSLAGELGGMNLHALVGNEFGGIPAGTPPPPAPAASLRAGSLDLRRPGLGKAVGSVALIAPALDDTLHPSFFMNMLFLGSEVQRTWMAVRPPLTSRFQYSLFDEPELARFYPPPAPGSAADSALDVDINDSISGMGVMVFGPEALGSLLRGVGWLLGGEMPPEIVARARRDPGVLATLSQNQAARELWGGEPFWSEYRRRLEPDMLKPFHTWVVYLLDRSHRIKVMIHPPR